MLNFTCSLQAKFYTMSSITRPCSVRLLTFAKIKACLTIIIQLLEINALFLQWALGIHQQIKESEGSKRFIVSGSTQEFLFSLSQ